MYADKLDNLDKIDTFLERHKLPKVNQDEAECLNRPVITKEIKLVVQKNTHQNILDPDGFTGQFYQTFTGELIPMFHKLFLKLEEEKT